ncbi:hypothetical protein [Aquitalea denitrificans]|uniref:hypothetical protein n=1 Tax=Aquitalea denitrificans TaxID=519081 RepID=UPI0013580AE0|nr:hypothetical protein [Aquitalea denitrificans]
MKKSAALPIALICLGAVWFLKSTALLPNTSTMLALLLIIAGVLLGLFDGLNKSTLVSCPLLVYAGAAIYLRDNMGLHMSHLLSLGMVLAGLLMLLSRSDRIPERSTRWRSLPDQQDRT